MTLPAPLLLLYPQTQSLKNRLAYLTRRDRVKAILLGAVALLFCAAILLASRKVLHYFYAVPELGPYLSHKLLNMVVVTLLSLLLFSNVITSLATFFLSEDLPVFLSRPVPTRNLFVSRLLLSATHSSWMALLFGLPFFVAYGQVQDTGPIYFFAMAFALLCLVLIAASIGSLISLFLVAAFPARRIKDVLLICSLIFLILLYASLRFSRPELLLDPDAFQNFMDFLRALKAPSSPYLPTTWAAQLLSESVSTPGGEPLFYGALLLSHALMLTALAQALYGWLYLSCYSKTQEGRRALTTAGGVLDRLLSVFLQIFPLPTRHMIMKDIKSFFRDTAQWSQLLIVGALVVVYVYNFSVLPLDRASFLSFYMQNLVSFLNLALAGFVLAGMAVRFVFPAVSLEGPSFWIVRSAPISTRAFLWSKFWLGWMPLTVLGGLLIEVTNKILGVPFFMEALSLTTLFLATFGITSLAVNMGARYPKFNYDDVARISTSFGGVLYMIVTLGFVAALVLAEARPVYLLVIRSTQGTGLSLYDQVTLTASFSLVALAVTVAFLLPIRYGARALEELEQ